MSSGSSVTETEVDNFRFFAQYSAASGWNYNVTPGSIVSCPCDTLCPNVTANKAVVQATLNKNGTSQVTGFIATDPTRNLIVVSFPGSNSDANWVINLQIGLEPCDDLVSGCKVHTGFMSAWRDAEATVMSTVQQLLNDSKQSYGVVVTGYSLGAAVATLAAAHLRKANISCDLYTYGSPRVGNGVFASFVTNQPGAQYRLTHFDDPAPQIPPLWCDYRHTSPEYWMFDQNSTAINYGPGDIKICTDIDNITCNAGMIGLTWYSHSFYFEEMGCANNMNVKRSDAIDTALKQRLNEYAARNREYAASLARFSVIPIDPKDALCGGVKIGP